MQYIQKQAIYTGITYTGYIDNMNTLYLQKQSLYTEVGTQY